MLGVVSKFWFSHSLSKYYLEFFFVPDLSPSLGAPANLIGQLVLCDRGLLLLTKGAGFHLIPLDSGAIRKCGLNSRRPRFYCKSISKFNYVAISRLRVHLVR